MSNSAMQSQKAVSAHLTGKQIVPFDLHRALQPVPTRHRRHACIKMQTALSGNTRTWPSVVSILVQRRWWGANIETALGQILVFAGLHTGVCLHPPPPSIIFSPADQGTFSKTAGQSQAYYNTWNWEWGTHDVTHLQILTWEVAMSRASSVLLTLHRKHESAHGSLELPGNIEKTDL